MARRSRPNAPGARELAIAASVQKDLEAGELARAWDESQAALRKHPDSQPIHVLMAELAYRQRADEVARRHAERALRAGEHPHALMLLSELERRAGRTDEALAYADRAAPLLAYPTALSIQRACILEEAGRFAEARAVVDPLVAGFEARGAPLPSSLRFELAKLLVHEKSYDEAVEVIDGVLGEDTTPDQLRVLIGYLKAKALDRSGRYAEAFGAASVANEIGRVEFDPALYESQVSALIETWSAERMERFPLSSCETSCPCSSRACRAPAPR
jgi:tetratricopeptide (TPR) repeat protein